MKEIVSGLYTFEGLILGHVYAIKDKDGLTIIDAGLASSTPKILKQLAEGGYAPSDVKRILVTHAHYDHVYGLPALQKATGAEVISSSTEKPIVEGKQPTELPPRESLSFIGKLMQPRGTQFMPAVAVSRTLEDGEVMDVFGGLQAIATPGHTRGQLSFWQPLRRILITGDALFNLPSLRLPLAAFTQDMREAKRSIAKLAKLQPEVICFGHGEPMLKDSAKRLSDFSTSL
jgi:glyoxylase-like metal-dependent hydrolase (beta-lactamase superfamily II)